MDGILIIKSSKTQLKLEKEALSNEGYDIVGEACDFNEGREAFFELKPELVIIDMDFGEQAVLKFITDIKKSVPDTLVIVDVEEKKMSLVIRAVKSGADEYVMKPVDMREMIQKIRKIYR